MRRRQPRSAADRDQSLPRRSLTVMCTQSCDEASTSDRNRKHRRLACSSSRWRTTMCERGLFTVNHARCCRRGRVQPTGSGRPKCLVRRRRAPMSTDSSSLRVRRSDGAVVTRRRRPNPNRGGRRLPSRRRFISVGLRRATCSIVTAALESKSRNPKVAVKSAREEPISP